MSSKTASVGPELCMFCQYSMIKMQFDVYWRVPVPDVLWKVVQIKPVVVDDESRTVKNAWR